MSNGRFSNLEMDGGAPRTGPASDRGVDAQASSFGTRVKDATYHLHQAEAQELAGDHEAALRSFSAALNENPLLLDAWVGQLLMLIALEEYPEARVWADKALEKFPDNPDILAAKSIALHRMGREREGRELNDAALQSPGESAVVWLCRGELMMAESGPAADGCLEKAVRASQHKGLTMLRAGSALIRAGRYGPAMAVLQDAASELGRSARAWYLLGLAQDRLGLRRQAQVSYRQAVDLAPATSTYRSALGGGPGRIRSFFRRLFRR